MQTSHSPSHVSSNDHVRIARSAILNGVAIPAVTAAILAARGVNVGELEQRLRASVEFQS